MDTRNLGITLGTRKEEKDNGEDSRVLDWSTIFMLLKNRGFSHKEILQLSYPQFNAYMNNINNELTYNITIPYLGGKSEKEEKGIELNNKEDILNVFAKMNNDFK